MIIKILILIYDKQGIKTIVLTDSSNYISSKVFFQLENTKLLYFIIFFLKNFNLTKCKYKIYNKKLLAIIKYLNSRNLN